jgi:transposase
MEHVMKTIIGIDVAKNELVIFYHEKYFTIDNTEKSISLWFDMQQVNANNIDLVAFEPTGGYERVLKMYLIKRAIPFCMPHANYIRAFAQSTGQLAKTDKIDAKIITDYASIMNLKPTTKTQDYEELKGLLDRREQLINMKNQDKNRLENEAQKRCIRSIKNHIKWLEKEIDLIETEIKNYVDSDEKIKKQITLYQSIPSIGWLTAIRIYVDLPELTLSDERSVTALVGLAPMNRDSGKIQKKRHIYGGRNKVRKALYMAVISAIRFNSAIKLFYKRLKQKGKSTLVAIVAASRKLLLIVQSVAKRQTPWVECKQ